MFNFYFEKDLRNRVSRWIGVKPSLIVLKSPEKIISDSDDVNILNDKLLVAYYNVKVEIIRFFESNEPFNVELSSLIDLKELEFRIRRRVI